MYGRPGLGKDFLAFRQTNRERSCIRPLNAAFERGPWWRSRIEFQSLRRAVTRDDGTECFDPGFLTILPSHQSCPSDWMSASAAAVALRLGSSRPARAVAVWFSFNQHGPENPGGLCGKRHQYDLVGSSREQAAQPRVADTTHALVPQIAAFPIIH